MSICIFVIRCSNLFHLSDKWLEACWYGSPERNLLCYWSHVVVKLIWRTRLKTKHLWTLEVLCCISKVKKSACREEAGHDTRNRGIKTGPFVTPSRGVFGLRKVRGLAALLTALSQKSRSFLNRASAFVKGRSCMVVSTERVSRHLIA